MGMFNNDDDVEEEEEVKVLREMLEAIQAEAAAE
jgi:hypothetical protein